MKDEIAVGDLVWAEGTGFWTTRSPGNYDRQLVATASQLEALRKGEAEVVTREHLEILEDGYDERHTRPVAPKLVVGQMYRLRDMPIGSTFENVTVEPQILSGQLHALVPERLRKLLALPEKPSIKAGDVFSAHAMEQTFARFTAKDEAGLTDKQRDEVKAMIAEYHKGLELQEFQGYVAVVHKDYEGDGKDDDWSDSLACSDIVRAGLKGVL